MKRMILITTLALGVFSCEKKEVEPTKTAIDYTKKFKVIEVTGSESVTIDGITTNIGAMNEAEFMEALRSNFPSGVSMVTSRKSGWHFIAGWTTFEYTGEIEAYVK